jgi:PHD/YefM family antitoxin component YafN of YafNO toxin-antitoxin module
MDQVAATGEVLLITKNGRPVAIALAATELLCPGPVP